MKISDCYFLGTITKMHGLKGHVTLKLDTDDPSEYYKMESLFVEINGQLVPFFIEEIDVMKSNTLKILFKDVEAGMIVGKETYLPLSTLPKLTGNKFYYFEVVGFEIMENNTKAGTIISINDKAAQPLFIIAREDSKELAIPIIKEWILEVDREAKQIKMNLPEGILEL